MTPGRKTGLLVLCFGLSTLGAMVLTNVPDVGETNGEAIRFYASNGGPIRTFTALYLTLVAVVCLLTALSRLLADDAATGWSRSLCWGAGVGYAALSVAAASAFATPTAVFKLDASYQKAVDPQFARAMSSLGDGLLLVAAPLMLAICLAALSRASRRQLPRGASRATAALSFALLFGWTWFPLLLVVVWALVLGAALTVRRVATPSALAP